MKKLLLIFLILVVCLSVVACNNANSNKEEDATSSEGKSTVSDTNEIELNAENILDYLAFDIKLENIQRYTSIYAEGYIPPEGEEAEGFTECDIKLNVFAKKPVSFDDVKITFDLMPTRDEYVAVLDKQLQLKYDGSAVDTYKYSCEVGGDNPEFKVVVKKVTGKVITK